MTSITQQQDTGAALLEKQGFCMEIHFTKLQENGNDFIVIDEWEHVVIPEDMKGQFAAIYCDRRFGIGADGVIYLSKGEAESLRMRLIQPDETEAGMYGIGIRCLVKYAYDAGYVKETCTVETLAGKMDLSMIYREEDFFATITMSPPRFDRKEIPATGSGEYGEKIGEFAVYAVNTGDPHAVILVDSVDAIDLMEAAPAIRRHTSFPYGINVNFVEKAGDNSIRIRTYERGAEEEVFSCSSGAAASAAVVHKLGYAGTDVNVETRGGPLTIRLGEKTTLEGQARTVFSGAIPF